LTDPRKEEIEMFTLNRVFGHRISLAVFAVTLLSGMIACSGNDDFHDNGIDDGNYPEKGVGRQKDNENGQGGSNINADPQTTKSDNLPLSNTPDAEIVVRAEEGAEVLQLQTSHLIVGKQYNQQRFVEWFGEAVNNGEKTLCFPEARIRIVGDEGNDITSLQSYAAASGYQIQDNDQPSLIPCLAKGERGVFYGNKFVPATTSLENVKKIEMTFNATSGLNASPVKNDWVLENVGTASVAEDGYQVTGVLHNGSAAISGIRIYAYPRVDGLIAGQLVAGHPKTLFPHASWSFGTQSLGEKFNDFDIFVDYLTQGDAESGDTTKEAPPSESAEAKWEQASKRNHRLADQKAKLIRASQHR
jgi:hypothetical protein